MWHLATKMLGGDCLSSCLDACLVANQSLAEPELGRLGRSEGFARWGQLK